MTKNRRWSEGRDAALLTDLYELTMAQAYHKVGMNDVAVFELFFRSMPKNRNFLVACGLDDVLEYLEGYCFNEADVNYLASLAQFTPDFLEWLSELRFAGDVYAVPEGTVVFADEPVLQIVAPVVQAQLVETHVLNQIHYSTLVATKAARVVTAAAGRAVIDFGMRRTHGMSAAMIAARAGYISGIEATSNVLAGKVYGIPIAGTMAHSYVQCYDQEEVAFHDFARLYPETTLLVDTYDTLEGVRKLIEVARKMGDEFHVRAVRLDSGELVGLSEQVRKLLDDAGLTGVSIFASGNLDEYAISEITAAQAPIDGFGVGTKLGVSGDAPYLDCAYKLVEYQGEGRLKLSNRKATLPWRKQVFRQVEDGTLVCDVIARHGERQVGEPLLAKVMEAGERLPAGVCEIEQARAHSAAQIESLPLALRALDPAESPYPVIVSDDLEEDRARISQRFSWIPPGDAETK
jgi:nicotinate phosphoribosyltransferase